MPNVVLLMSDSHNPKISSVYGHPFVRTPHLERLAASGTVYENAYTPSPLCVPARSAFMTGRYVHEIEVFNNCKVIPAEHPSYGGVLASQGVRTVYVGAAANLYRNPFDLGFSEMPRVKRTEPSLTTSFVRNPLPRRSLNRNYGPRAGVWQYDIGTVDYAVRWLKETAPALTEPWVLVVNVQPPHYPLVALPEFWAMYDGLGDLPRYGPDHPAAQHPYAEDLRYYFNTSEATEEDIRGMRQGYYAAVTFVDRQLGRLLDALEQSGQLDQTVVAYTTDHGEMLGKFGLWWKHCLYEDAARIPLVVAGPGFAAGARVKTPVSLLDFQAAIFEAVGAERPADWRGEPLQHIPAADAERVVFAEYHGNGVRSGAFLVRKGDWKLIYNMAAPHQLFNLRDDPEELENVWEKEPAVARELEAELRRICDPEKVNERAHEKEREQLEVIRRLQARAEERP